MKQKFFKKLSFYNGGNLQNTETADETWKIWKTKFL